MKWLKFIEPKVSISIFLNGRTNGPNTEVHDASLEPPYPTYIKTNFLRQKNTMI